MALNKEFVQNIEINASGDKLLELMGQYQKVIDQTIAKLSKMGGTVDRGTDKRANAFRKEIQVLQRMVGEASTLANVFATLGGSKQSKFLSILDDQATGRKAVNAAKLRQELKETEKASDALSIRLFQLEQRIKGVTAQGQSPGKTDLTRVFQLKEAITQTQKLERELAKLDARARIGGGYKGESVGIREQAGNVLSGVMALAQNKNWFPKDGYTTNIALVEQLTQKLRAQAVAEQQAARASSERYKALQAETLKRINNSDPAQLLAQVTRASSNFRYTNDQARGFNMKQVNAEVDAGIAKLGRLADIQNRVLNSPTLNTERNLNRLKQAWDNISKSTSEAVAQQKAYNNLPERMVARVNEYLFSNLGATGLRVGGFMALAAGASAVFGAIQQGVGAVIDFDDRLAKLQAISGATDKQMRQMGEGILSVARDTRYAVSDVAEATTQIAQAGYSATESIDVLRASLSLATASGSNPAEAVDTVTGALGAFQLQASESAQVADTLVSGLNRSKLSIQQMQAAIQYVGATARESNVNLQELVTISASLSNAGIRSGSTIGTGLRQLIVDLQTPTDKFRKELEYLGLTLADVDVKALGVAGVVKRMTDAGFSAEAAYRSFENRAASAFLAFRGQIDTYDSLAQSIAGAGAAQEAQASAMESLSAQWQNLKNQLVAFLAEAGAPVVNALTTLTRGLAGVFDAINLLPSSLKSATLEFGLLIAAMTTGNPLYAVTAGLLALNDLLYSTERNTEKLKNATAEANAEYDKNKQTLTSVDEAINRLISRQTLLSTNNAALQTEVVTLTGRFQELAGSLSGVALNYETVMDAMLRYRGEVLRQAGLNAESTKIAAGNQINDFSARLRDLPSAFSLGGVALNGRAANAVKYIEKNASVDFSKLNADSLLNAQNNTQKFINDLSREKDLTGRETQVLNLLKKRLELLRQLTEARRQYNEAEKAGAVYEYRASARGQAGDKVLTTSDRAIEAAFYANEVNPGSGDSALTSVSNTLRSRMKSIRSRLAKLEGTSGEARALQDELTQIEASLARISSKGERRQDEARTNRSIQNKPGARLSVSEVADEIKKLIPGARITDTIRPASRQAGYDRAAGIKRDPNSAPHVTGNALDMAPIPGKDPMEIVAILEGMGLQVTGAPVKAAGIRYIKPEHGTGRHWHFQWSNKKTEFERRGDAEADKNKRALEQLLQQIATDEVQIAEKNISTYLTNGKAGTISIPSIAGETQKLFDEYRKARANEFKVKNPTAGATKAELDLIALSKRKFDEETEANIQKYQADISRVALDSAASILNNTLQAAEKSLENRIYENGAEGRRLDNSSTVASGEFNMRRYGQAGVDYIARQKRAADLNADRKTYADRERTIAAERTALADYQNRTEGLDPESDAGRENLKQIEATTARINELLKEQDALKASIAARDGSQAEDVGTLEQRLKDQARAWIENSGALDSWEKVATDNIGPALDNLTDGFNGLFDSVFNGSKSFGAALGDMVVSFARMVQQIILKALALKAVKGLLKAVGLDIGSSFEGGPVMPTASQVNTTTLSNLRASGRYTGGITHLMGGGAITRGMPTRDSALYNLAQGEFVVRNKSVRELGLPFMNAINKHGRKGLEKMAGAGSVMQNFQMPKQETNVFVVQEKQAPPMGPNDVLITIQNDILQNGATKRLIKQVSQGG